MKHLKVSSFSDQATRALGAEILTKLRPALPILFVGDVGCGKTTFIRGIARSLNIRRPIQSPTFLIVKTYPIVRHKKLRRLCHIDEYRLSSSGDLRELGIDELLADPAALCCIENPHYLRRRIGEYWLVQFWVKKSGERTILIKRKISYGRRRSRRGMS